jgi:RNA polymerase sigma-70 factor (ECF subfamily)
MAFPRLVQPLEPAADALPGCTDDELMALCRVGLRPAFRVLMERHAERVVRTCVRFVADPQLGRELAQDTWVLVWQGRDKYRTDGGFVLWLTTLARNHCRNELRRRKVAAAFTEQAAFDAPKDAGQLDDLLREERQRRVRRALQDLSSPLREALLLRFAEELRYDEMSRVVGSSESTLRSRVHHALKALKQKLEKDS